MVFDRKSLRVNHQSIKIGILYTGGRSWIGGEQYILNLLWALKNLRQRGVHPYDFTLVLCYQDIKLENYVRLVFNAADEYQYIQTNTPPIRRRDQAISIINLYIPRRYRFLQARKEIRSLSIKDIDVLYPFDFSSSLPSGTTGIGWIPDFQSRVEPQFFSENDLTNRISMEERIVENAGAIVFSSLDSMKNFTHFFPSAKAKGHTLRFHSYLNDSVWTADPKQIQAKYNLPDRFFLCCNQFWKHKNHELVFEAIAQATKDISEVFIVFTGHTHDYRANGYFDDLCRKASELGIRQNIAILGLVPKSDQQQLLRQSIGIIQPSLSEGWSTIVEEIRALNKPSILSDLQVHLEQDPPNAIYFDRFSRDGLHHAMVHSWKLWDAGPNLEAETQARRESRGRLDKMANDFLSIVHENIVDRNEKYKIPPYLARPSLSLLDSF